MVVGSLERDRVPLHGNGQWRGELGNQFQETLKEFGMFSLFFLCRFYFEALHMCLCFYVIFDELYAH